MHRILSSSYRGFSIYAVTAPDDAVTSKLNLQRRAQVWFFLWWRQIIAELAASVLTAPTSMLLGLFGVRSVFGIHVGFLISTFGGVLAIGPVLLKMLIGHQFNDFRLEVRRLADASGGHSTQIG